MVDLMRYYEIYNFLTFHYYIIIRSSMVFCLSSGDIYLSFGTSLSIPIFSISSLTVSQLFCDEVLLDFL